MNILFFLCLASFIGKPVNFGHTTNAVQLVPREPEDETLIRGRLAWGYYGAFITKFTQLNNSNALLLGGRGGLLINHSFFIGGAGYGLVNDIDIDNIPPRQDYIMRMGYGGLTLEYILCPRRLLHLSFYSLIGGGGVCLQQDDWYEPWQDDAFFIVEPGMDIMLNITKYFRIGLGASYRYTSGININGLTDEDIMGPTACLTLKFGDF